MVGVPESPGRWHPQLRLLPHRHCLAPSGLCLFFIAIDRRIVYLAGVTDHPVGPWATQQARDLVANLEDRGRPFRSLVRDRDAKFVGPFDEVVTSVGARVIKTPFRAPTAKPFAERFVLTARSECLDWALVRSERHAERLLHEFVAHYNQERPHRDIGLEQPVPKLALHPFDSGDDVERVDRLGGLLHEYRLAA